MIGGNQGGGNQGGGNQGGGNQGGGNQGGGSQGIEMIGGNYKVIIEHLNHENVMCNHCKALGFAHLRQLIFGVSNVI